MYLKKILWIVSVAGLLIAACFSYYIYSVMFSPNTAFQNETAYVFISSDASFEDVQRDLSPLLKDVESFSALARQKKYDRNIKAGRYRIASGMTNNDIINSLRSGNLPVRVSFNNQNSLEDLAGRIGQQIEADSLSLIKAFKAPQLLAEMELDQYTALSMYLPNTYELFWNTSATAFVERMIQEYRSFWTESRKRQAEQLGLSPTEVVILAALVQEESKQNSEQPRIAGVYLNRLNSGWPLQADPTVKFALYQQSDWDGTVVKRILTKHLAIDSPFNTYKNLGLPPAVIAMPDLSTVGAVLQAESHSYFFFSADPENPGFHKFAKTLTQHNKNAKSYHRYLNNKGVLR